MVESYGEPVSAVVWGEDMVCHAALMARGGGVGGLAEAFCRPKGRSRALVVTGPCFFVGSSWLDRVLASWAKARDWLRRSPFTSSRSRSDAFYISLTMVVVRDHFHSSSPFPKPLDLASRSFHLHLLLPSFDQAGMVSSPSFSVSSFSSTRSSLVRPPREEYRPSDSLGDQSGPQSSSSGVMVGADAKALQAMKSHHDFDSTVSLESLASIRKRFSILNEYVLHTLGPGQRSYHSYPGGFSISIDALEAGLRLPLHPVIGECLGWWWISPGQVAPNPWCYIITFLGEYKGSGIVPTWDLFLSCFRLCRGQGGYYLTSRAAPPPPPTPHVESGSASKVQEIPVEEASASAGVDGRDYHAIRMCNLPEKAPDAPLEADLRPLTQGMLGHLRGVRTQVRQIEIELLELTRSKDVLQEDLPRRAIEDYKKSPGFEMGLVQMGRVSLEYGYQLALARLQA
ncbi:hypothetical protein BHE74_00034220 [Ensete ventricosum]|nr:hypothetical protein BHE74_00034220 [Ensete ventricosum]